MIPLCLERALVLAAEEWEGWGPEPHLLLAIICHVNFHFAHVLDEGSGEISRSLPVLVFSSFSDGRGE